MRPVRDKPNRSLNQGVNVFSKKDVSQPETLFVSPTSKPVQSQTTSRPIEVASPALSSNCAKQTSFQFDDPIKVSNVRPVRDKRMAHSYESFPAFNLTHSFPASSQTNCNHGQFSGLTEPQKHSRIPSFHPPFLERSHSIPSYRTGSRLHSLEWLVHLSVVVSQLMKR